MKAYIINLERSEKRREHIVREVEAQGLDYEIVSAVDGAALTPSDFDELCDMETVRKYPEWLSPGMIGASLSHRRVYGRILENEDNVAVVIEDDAILPLGFTDILHEIEKNIEIDEVVLLHYSSFEPLQLSSVNSVDIGDRVSLVYPMFLKGVGGAVCYVIARKAAESLYNGVLPIASSPDSWVDFFDRGCLKSIRCLFPMMVDHLGVKSTINATTQGSFRVRLTEAIDHYEIPVLHQFLRKLRRKSLSSRTNFVFSNSRSPYDRRGPNA